MRLVYMVFLGLLGLALALFLFERIRDHRHHTARMAERERRLGKERNRRDDEDAD